MGQGWIDAQVEAASADLPLVSDLLAPLNAGKELTMMDSENTHPTARTEGLVTMQVSDGLIVYDRESHQIHHLNRATAAVWSLCDGKIALSELLDSVRLKVGENFESDHLLEALAILDEVDLLTNRLELGPNRVKQSRRNILRRAATIGGAVTIPTIASITAASAQTVNSNCAYQGCCSDGTSVGNVGIICCGPSPDTQYCGCSTRPGGIEAYCYCQNGGTLVSQFDHLC